MNAKVKLYSNMGWGLLVLFALFGAVLGKPSAPYMLVITVIIWAAMKILSEAYYSLVVLRYLRAGEKTANDEEKKDDRTDA